MKLLTCLIVSFCSAYWYVTSYYLICCLMQLIIIFPMVTMCSLGVGARLGPAGDCLCSEPRVSITESWAQELSQRSGAEQTGDSQG